MGGRVHAGDEVHREALMAKDLSQGYPSAIHIMIFANHDEASALKAVVRELDTDRSGHLSETEKNNARIVLFGHSWGGSETVNFARDLNARGIPILLTIQVDSVQKLGENDATVPPNVNEAINFYQTEGLLHGRREIHAQNPERTKILGNFESKYNEHPVSCAGYPWYARAFMKQHIEIENDAALWSRIEAMIVARADVGGTAIAVSSCVDRKSDPGN